MNIDKKAIYKKLLLEPVDALSLTPFVIGATIGLGAWAVNMDSGLTIASGLILGLVSAGIYLNRLIFGWGKNYERIVREWREKVESSRDKELDRLYLALKKDGDERTQSMLKDLRTLTKALMSEDTDTLAISAMDIVSDVDKLFQRCVDFLRESLDLWETAKAVERDSIRESLLAQRETIINEVEQSLDNLGHVLSGLKKANIHTSKGQALSDLREELSSRLRIAEQVEARMANLRSGNDYSEDEKKYLKHLGSTQKIADVERTD